MSLYNLMRFRFAFAALLVAEAVGVVWLTSARQFPATSAAFVVGASLLAALGIIPWTEDQRPPPPTRRQHAN